MIMADRPVLRVVTRSDYVEISTLGQDKFRTSSRLTLLHESRRWRRQGTRRLAGRWPIEQ
jgi:hypothetical protein